jgi:tight adherence protein B
VSLLAAFVCGLGLPRFILSRVIKRRQAKFLIEFANAIDIIVRGVKSGLPLSDCLQIIAAEAPEPVRGEFVDLVEQQKVGVPLSRAFERMSERMPLQEVNFFAIVIAIQAQTGGSLAEALGNLSSVLRDRYRLQAKVRAFSAEAKASAMIIGSLPPCSASTQRCAYRGNQALARCLTSALAPSAHSAISGKSRMART